MFDIFDCKFSIIISKSSVISSKSSVIVLVYFSFIEISSVIGETVKSLLFNGKKDDLILVLSIFNNSVDVM